MEGVFCTGKELKVKKVFFLIASLSCFSHFVHCIAISITISITVQLEFKLKEERTL